MAGGFTTAFLEFYYMLTVLQCGNNGHHFQSTEGDKR